MLLFSINVAIADLTWQEVSGPHVYELRDVDFKDPSYAMTVSINAGARSYFSEWDGSSWSNHSFIDSYSFTSLSVWNESLVFAAG